MKLREGNSFKLKTDTFKQKQTNTGSKLTAYKTQGWGGEQERP